MEKRNKNYKFVPQHVEKVCYMCDGTGYKLKPLFQTDEETKFETVVCTYCGGTGIYLQTYYHLICNGECWGIDTIK